MIYYDTETCGLHGMCVLIQYAKDEGPVTLYEPWKNPISRTLDVIDYIINDEVCGFNLAYDSFHLQKLYTVLYLTRERFGNVIPEYHIEDIAMLEPDARTVDLCLKPKAALDLMLHSRKGPYQSLMNRSPVRIRRVPVELALELQEYLNENVQFPDIYFRGTGDRWKILENEQEGMVDVQLAFRPSTALKHLAEHVLGHKGTDRFDDVDLPKHYRPAELGYAPFALAVAKPPYWVVRKGKSRRFAWPKLIRKHIEHWAFNSRARTYAEKDVEYTRELHHHFLTLDPSLVPGDDDSELACMVGAVRWRGFAIDTERLQAQREAAASRHLGVPVSPGKARQYIVEGLSELEQSLIKDTKKTTLDYIITEYGDEQPGVRAKEVKERRMALKELELYDKLLKAGRFHVSVNVIGTLSSRMSGRDGLNPQAIKRTTAVRECFPLADFGLILGIGDFDAFEVVLTVAAFDDKRLEEDLRSGKKIHALFAAQMFPDMTYEMIMESKGTDDDRYTLGKNGVFSMIYGGDWTTLVKRYKVQEDVAKAAFNRFLSTYEALGIGRQKIMDDFCSMSQPGGLGSKVYWKEPAEYIESLMGFRRYFTLENIVSRALFQLANNMPQEWKARTETCHRGDRIQKVGGALSSALYGCVFGIQGRNMRAAMNHIIQSAGATITKHVERRVWDQQPCGVGPWMVVPMNVHDEIAAPCHPDVVDQVASVVSETVESFRPRVPLIEMSWNSRAVSWAEK